MIDDIGLIKLLNQYKMYDYNLKFTKEGYYILISNKTQHNICMTKNRNVMKKAIELIGGSNDFK